MNEQINILIVVDDAFKSDLGEVANRLTARGFLLRESLNEIGVLVGSAPENLLNDLSTVLGVSMIEIEGHVNTL